MPDGGVAPRVHRAICVAIAAFAVAFTLPMLVPLPLLWYHPFEGAWRFEVAPTTFAMDWYGRVLWGVTAAAAGYGLGRLLPMQLAATRRAKYWWALGTMLVVLAAMTIVVVLMVERTPVPLAPPGVGVSGDNR